MDDAIVLKMRLEAARGAVCELQRVASSDKNQPLRQGLDFLGHILGDGDEQSPSPEYTPGPTVPHGKK